MFHSFSFWMHNMGKVYRHLCTQVQFTFKSCYIVREPTYYFHSLTGVDYALELYVKWSIAG